MSGGGPHKGVMVTVNAAGLARDPLDLWAPPSTLTISDDGPSVVLEGCDRGTAMWDHFGKAWSSPMGVSALDCAGGLTGAPDVPPLD